MNGIGVLMIARSSGKWWNKAAPAFVLCLLRVSARASLEFAQN